MCDDDDKNENANHPLPPRSKEAVLDDGKAIVDLFRESRKPAQIAAAVGLIPTWIAEAMNVGLSPKVAAETLGIELEAGLNPERWNQAQDPQPKRRTATEKWHQLPDKVISDAAQVRAEVERRGRRPGTRYPQSLRELALRVLLEAEPAGVSPTGAAAGMGLAPKTLLQWKRRSEQPGSSSQAPPTPRTAHNIRAKATPRVAERRVKVRRVRLPTELSRRVGKCRAEVRLLPLDDAGRRRYPPSLRHECVALAEEMLSLNFTLRVAAKRLDLPYHTLYAWLRGAS